MNKWTKGAMRYKESMQRAVGSVTAIAAEQNADTVITALGDVGDALSSVWVAGTAYIAGEIVQHTEQNYLVMQAVTAQAHQAPGSTGMLAIYRPLPRWHDGYAVWMYGMDVKAGDIVWNAAKTQLYKALQAQAPSTWEPGSAAALWQLYTGETESEEPQQPTVPKWVDLPEGHVFNVGDRFMYNSKEYIVLRQFNKQSNWAPPALIDNFYKLA